MHLPIRIRILLTLGILLASGAAFAQTSYTTAASGPWSQASTWNPMGVPESADSVTIQSSHSITLAGSIAVANAAVAGTLIGSGTLTVSGTCNWTAGTFTGGATLTIPSGAVMNISGASTKTMDNGFHLVVGGTANWSGGTIILNYISLLDVQPGGVFVAQSDNTITNTYYNGSISNSGTFRKSAGAGTTTISSGVPFANSGRLEVSSGNINAQTLMLNTGSTLGNGFTISSGSTTIAGPSTVELGAAMTMSGGTLKGTSNLTINGTLNWTGGVMSDGASVTVPAGKTMTIGGAAQKTLQNGFHLNVVGTLNWTGGTIILNYLSLLDIQSGGLFDARSNDSITNTYYNGSIANAGTFRKSVGTGTTIVASGVPFSNGGRIEILTGSSDIKSLTLNAGSVIGGTKFTVMSGTTSIAGAASVETGATMTLAAGTLTGSSTLTVNGTLQFTGGVMDGGATINVPSTGSLNFSGTSSKTIGSGFDVNVAGTATWTGGSIIMNYIGRLDILAGGLFDAQSDNAVINTYYSGSISNAGTFRKSAGSGTTSVSSDVAFTNSGRLDVQSGKLTVAALTLTTGSVIGGNGLTVSTGTMSVIGTSTVEAGSSMTLATGGVLSGSTPLTVDGTLQWTGGTMDGSTASATISPAGVLNISGPTAKTLGSGFGLNVAGIAHWTGGTFNINYTSLLNIPSGGLFLVETDGTITNTYYNGSITNNGIFRKSAGAGLATITNGVPFANNGRLEVLSGTLDARTLTLNAGSVIAGTGLTIGSGSTTIAGPAEVEALASMTLAPGGTLKGSSNLTINGTMNWTGGVMIDGASVTVPAGKTITISGSSPKTLQNGFQLNVAGTVNWTEGSIAVNYNSLIDIQAGGVFDAQSDDTITNTYYSGSITNSGTFRKSIGSGSTTIGSGVPVSNNARIEILIGTMSAASLTLNAGSVIAGTGFRINSGTTTLAGASKVEAGATMTLAAGTVNGSSSLTVNGKLNWIGGSMDSAGSCTIAAGGTLNISGTGAKVISNGFDLLNAGTIFWSDGNIHVNYNALFDNQAGGLFNIGTDAGITNSYYNGTFTNNGTLRKSNSTGTTVISSSIPFTNAGTIDIQAGALQVTNPSLTGTTILNFGISGTTPLTGFGRLAVTGAVNLAGTIDIDVPGPFVPQGGDQYAVITYTSRSGSLNESLAFGTGRSLSTTYNATSLTLTASGPSVTPPLSPSSDTVTGGTIVTINGTGFASVPTVTFGATASTSVNFVNSGQITAVAPAHSAGTVDVVVTNPDAQPTTAFGAFTYTTNGDLSLTKTATVTRIATSGSYAYNIVVSNSGPSSSLNVSVTDTLPAGITSSGYGGTGWSCSDNAAAPPTITCAMASLGAGTAPTITINVTAPSTSNPALTNTATVTSTTLDPNLTNNGGSATVEVITPPSTITVTSDADGGPGTLRLALDDVLNGLCTSPCTIAFNLSPILPIQPLTALPSPLTPVVIDGTTQPGYAGIPLIEINGSQCACGVAISLGGSGSTVRGLSITSFSSSGLHLSGSGGHQAIANYIGVTTSQTGSPNGNGIEVDSSNNTIGGASTGDGNVISANTGNGIDIGAGVDSTAVEGNSVGTSADGSGSMPNGVGIAIGNATNTVVEGNTIAFNNADGIYVSGGTGHHITTNAIFGNGESGIDLLSVPEPTTNDSGDGDTGPNNLQNTPVITSAVLVSGNLRVTLDVDSAATSAGSIEVEIFEESGAHLDTACFNGNSLSNALVIVPAGTTAAGQSIVATATSFSTTCGATTPTVGDGTSEYSAGAVVAACTPPTVTVSATAATFCTGGSVTLSANASGGTPPYTYQWYSGATLLGGETSATLIVVTGGNYSVTATNAIGCSATSAETTIAEAAPPVATITAGGPTTFCAGGGVVLTASAGSSWLWSAGGATTQSITATTSGNYSVTVTDANGCSATSAPTTVTVQTTPTATIAATGPTTFCQGGSVTLTASNGTSWLWSNSATTQSISVATSGNFSVTVSNGTCSATSSPTTVTVDPAPTVSISGPPSVCLNTPFVLDAGSGFSSYLWSGGQTSRTITVSQAVAKTYSVTVTNAAGCSASTSRVVPLTPAPDATIFAPASVLANSTGNTASAPVQGGATYAWIITNGTITGGQGTNAITFTASGAGLIDLHLTVTIGGCSAVRTISVTVEEADMAVVKSAATTVETGATLVYTIDVANHGPFAADGVTITDFLPSGTSLVNVASGPWSCAQTQNEVNCTGNAVAGSRSTITITVTAPQRPGTIRNIVKVFSASDPNPSNDFDTATTTVTAPVICATVPPALSAPADGATDLPSPVTFGWSDVDALSYEVWIISGSAPSLLDSTTSTALSAEVPSGTFRWFVIARFAAGCSPLVSAERSFTVRTSDACQSHGAPQIGAPLHGATATSPVPFAWTLVPQAIGYRLWIEADGTAPQDIGTTDGAVSLTAAVPPGSIVAYVDALFGGCPATRSPSIAFTVPTPDPCAARAAASPIAPANNATVNTSSVEFRWNPANGANGYRLWASIDGAAAAVLGTTDATSLTVNIDNGDVFWWLESLYDGCASTESQRFHFTIPPKTNCSTARPQLLGPSDGANLTNANVTFTWGNVLEAVGYEVYLAAGQGTPVLIGTTTASTTSLTHLVPPGNLEWTVVANVDRCPSRESQKSNFTFTPSAGCIDNQRSVLVSPLDDIVTTAPIDFSWSAPAGVTRYELYVVRGTNAPALVVSTTTTSAPDVNLANGRLHWFVRAWFSQPCSPLDSEEQELEVVAQPSACAELDAPVISAPGQISSGVPFLVQWAPSIGATNYQLQIASNSDFESAELITTSATEQQFIRTNTSTSPLALFARVRAIDIRCTPIPTSSPYGPVSAIFILPTGGSDGTAPLGSGGMVTFTIPLGSELAGQSFTAVPNVPWLSVSPASGVVGAGGTILTAIANTAGLPIGASLGAVTITLNTLSSGKVQSHGTTLTIPTISISLVTPVTPSLKTAPPPDALIIAAVAHANGINARFQSDVRVSNTSPQLLKYQLTFTPSGSAGVTSGKQTTFSVEPGHTIALDDILKSWFGTGGDSTIGMLEIRPLTETATSTSSLALSGLPNLVTFASSRTFNVTANGTFGQYIPAVPFANFVGRSLDLSKPSLLSLQQIAQSDRFRTNLGLVEGSGEPASLLVRVFGDSGQKLTEFPVNLAGGEHTQLNAFLSQQGIHSLNDGRVEIQVLSAGGKVTAYASVLDNQTNDPLLVSPVTLTDTGASRWVVPGVADLNNGFTNWQTDMRVFNAGSEPVDATLSFYSQAGGAPKTASITINAGQVRQFDKTLATLFNVTNDGGAIHINTSSAARLIATARTYNQTTGGTYGQFISAVTPLEAAGLGSRPLQLLQVEESSRYRSNIGLAEVTGNPVKIEISVVPPDAKITTFTELTLAPNEFRQIGSLLKSVGLDGTFNARVSIRVIEGSGRVTAYASVIDMLTNDPTYLPAQ